MEQARARSLLQRMGAVSAGLVAVMLVGGLKSLLDVLQGLGLHNWLVILFQINLGRVDYDSLKVLNPLDFLILLLVGMTLVGLWPVLARGKKVWISIAVAQPFLGIVLLIVTHLLGRSAVMGGSLVAALLMLRTPGCKSVGWLGVTANVLLLVGDFGTTGSEVPPLAVCLGIGYLLLLVWFAWIAFASWRQIRHT